MLTQVSLLILLIIRNCNCDTAILPKSIQIVNHSGVPLEVYWINPITDERVPMTYDALQPGKEHPLDTYVGHEFEIMGKRFTSDGTIMKSDGTTSNNNSRTNRIQCVNLPKNACHRTRFDIRKNDPTFAIIDSHFRVSKVNRLIERSASPEMTPSLLLESCHNKTNDYTQQKKDNLNPNKILEDLYECYERALARFLEEGTDKIAFQADIRITIAATLENHTCDDETLSSSDDVRTESWLYPSEASNERSASSSNKPNSNNERLNYTIHIKHDRPASKIHVIDNFIKEDECAMMEQLAEPLLHDAAVADGKGGSKVSEHRKAKQAAVAVPWDDEMNGNPVARVSRRVLDYANHVLHLNITEHGQEKLMSIQYFGRGINDTAPDRYTPHCDGDCTGLAHLYGNRMATMVMYCKVPDSGGHTNFQNANVHIRPEKYSAVFFSYMDPIKRIMDTGFTEHSGCPVYDGEKKIVTQWIRYGVDNDNPWDSFNSLGIKLSEIEPDI